MKSGGLAIKNALGYIVQHRKTIKQIVQLITIKNDQKKGIETMNNACGFVQKQSIFQNGS